jgi:hypothetical protein
VIQRSALALLALLCTGPAFAQGSGATATGQEPGKQEPAKPEPIKPEIEVVRGPEGVPLRMTQAEARVCLDRALGFLVRTQKPTGAWGTAVIEGVIDSQYAVESYYDWQVGAQAIGCLALMESPETPERRATLEKALSWLLSGPLVKRGNDWDNDMLWAALYGSVACARAAKDPRFQDAAWQGRIQTRGREFLAILDKNQVPQGGWGYYDNPFASERPKWATSFATATVLPALKEAERLGWITDPKIRERATEYVRRCALPNGAYEYDLNPVPRISGGEHINNIKGSLGRIQVCNWALASVGVKSVTPDKIHEGLENFFEHHRFLDCARMRPVPHEAYYANAGYFYFFGHYYAAQVINLLPEGEREDLHARLRPHIAKTLRKDGSCCDYLDQSWCVNASTGFAALTLALGLPPHAQKQP